MQPDTNASTEVARIAARLPPLWPNRPAAWFTQAEAQFHLAGITNEITKFYYVISHMGERYVGEIEDIVNSPPPRDPYTHLKNELIQRLYPTKEQRARQLFEFEEMGDRCPSQFLRHLRTLAPDIPSDYLRSLWSSRLPPNVRAILAGLPDVGATRHTIYSVTYQFATVLGLSWNSVQSIYSS
jgi:cleavage and polyadenylation specificity factor subunit 1